MFRNAKLGTKIASIAAALLIFTGLVAYMGYSGMLRVVEHVDIDNDVNNMVRILLNARQEEKDFIIRGDASYSDKVAERITSMKQQIQNTRAKLTHQENLDQMHAIDQAVDKYFMEFKEFVDAEKLKEATMAQMRIEAGKALGRLESLLAMQTGELDHLVAEDSQSLLSHVAESDDVYKMVSLFLDARKNEKEFIISRDDKYKTLVDTNIEQINKLGESLKAGFERQENRQLADEVVNNIASYVKQFDRFVELMQQQESYQANMVKGAQQAEKICEEARKHMASIMNDSIRASKTFIIGGSLAAVLLGMVLSFFTIRAINRAIRAVIAGLSEGAEQVTSAAGQVSATSQSLAEGSSEQAAGIEETSSSLEEMSSMTQQNADNSSQADHLMKDAIGIVENANNSMTELTSSMTAITHASEETSKIVKTIDEIAFQTNLLALNAAVEAARAGEAGAGFAVVADEVRNLAMRAAEAAKNTASLIEGTVKQVDEGAQLVERTSEAFAEMVESSRKVADIVADIAAASGEQAQGIEQINTAVSEMDKVTQQNAANAEESASAAEELSAQAEQMQGMVGRLVRLVEGRMHTMGVRSSQRRRQHKTPNTISASTGVIAHITKASRAPEQVIPMDDHEAFGDF